MMSESAILSAKAFCSAFLMLALSGCGTNNHKTALDAQLASEVLHELNTLLTYNIQQDGFSPPVAARIYAYCNIAAYETLVAYDYSNLRSLSGQINGLRFDEPELEKGSDPILAMTLSFSRVAKALVYRTFIFQNGVSEIIENHELNPDSTPAEYEFSIALADSILAWASKDMYDRTRSMPTFTPSGTPDAWEPTPPTFDPAIEPNWDKIRPFVLDDLRKYSVADPIPFNTDSDSEFYQSAMEVKLAVDSISNTNSVELCRHWDCNPFVSLDRGHFMTSRRQLTPGGHWMSIAQTACQMTKADVFKCTKAYTFTAIALHDAFIACWFDKYRTNLIRPVTYINRYMDSNWQPLLETPQFPEHPSGHSTVSFAAATVLTSIFGDGFGYIDSTNTWLGLQPRHYSSFFDASQEAAISRLYGGIHYMPAIESGTEQGKKVGEKVLSQINVTSVSEEHSQALGFHH